MPELTNFQKQFSRRIRNRRIELNLTVDQCVEIFNELAGFEAISRYTWLGWESEKQNHRDAPLKHFPLLAEVLELSSVRLVLPVSAESSVNQKFNHVQQAGLAIGQEIIRQKNAANSGETK